MNKKKLYIFSIEIKKLIGNSHLSDAINKINQAKLSQEELDFLFMCLHSEGYDVETDSFYICESDNSAFLSLVNLVQSKVSSKK
ncbi:MAG: hypothetical protein NC543_04000 [bacterium]|nr:hypothetical protein [bacterium]MCM1373777.1 hypothetical protein [Muribaculum sp.]